MQIEEFEPYHSIVITPAKMLSYYEKFSINNELYHWPSYFLALIYRCLATNPHALAIFNQRSLIAVMYEQLRCQHHLVQERNDQRPNIPCLTPLGFAHWMTLQIQTCPRKEYRRLQEAILRMPINNPDTNERFPKILPWRSFLHFEDRGIADHVVYSLSQCYRTTTQSKRFASRR